MALLVAEQMPFYTERRKRAALKAQRTHALAVLTDPSSAHQSASPLTQASPVSQDDRVGMVRSAAVKAARQALKADLSSLPGGMRLDCCSACSTPPPSVGLFVLL